MSGETLNVDPQVLQSAATSFDRSGRRVGRIQADAPLGTPPSGWELLTVDARRKAQQGATAAVTAAVKSVRKFSRTGSAAARRRLSSNGFRPGSRPVSRAMRPLSVPTATAQPASIASSRSVRSRSTSTATPKLGAFS